MSNKSETGYVRIKEKYPFHGKGSADLLAALKNIFAAPENKYIQKVVLEVGVPHIYVEKMVTEEVAGVTPKLSPLDLVRAQKMEEYAPQKDDQTALAHLWDMFRILRMENLEVGHILVGNKDSFQKWLGIRIPFNDLSVLGIPLHVVDLPDDVFIVCGTPDRTSDPEDITFSLKGTIP